MMKLLLFALSCAVLVAWTPPTNAQSPPDPNPKPPWWGVNDNYTGATGYDLSTAPTAGRWNQPDRTVPTPLPPFMTNNPERNFLQLTHEMTWQGSDIIGGRTGVAGVRNNGPNDVMADLEIGLDNQFVENWVKRVWVSFDMWTQMELWDTIITGITASSSHQPGFAVAGYQLGEPQTFGWRQVSIEFTLNPQPDWEVVAIDFVVPSLATLGIDNVWIASHCMPEPTTVGLLAIGAVAMLRRRRR